MQLDPEQLKAIASGEPLSITIDDDRFVVIRQETFDELRALAEQAELRSIFARSVESSDWNDPSMDVYDDYDNAKK